MCGCEYVALPPTAAPGTLDEYVCYFIIQFAQGLYLSFFLTPGEAKDACDSVFVLHGVLLGDMAFLVVLVQMS